MNHRLARVTYALAMVLLSGVAAATPVGRWGRDVNHDGAIDAVLLDAQGNVEKVVWYGNPKGYVYNFWVNGYNSDGWLAGTEGIDAMAVGPVLWDPRGYLHPIMPPPSNAPHGFDDGGSFDMTEAGWLCMDFVGGLNVEYNVHTGQVVLIGHRRPLHAPCGENDPLTNFTTPVQDEPPPDLLLYVAPLSDGIRPISEPAAGTLFVTVVVALGWARMRMRSQDQGRHTALEKPDALPPRA